ncbi:MAG: hypothetical protein QF645_09885 [Planctomycetota bacterium]|nr:hypothetical protein [Planctomycetota bacterium]
MQTSERHNSPKGIGFWFTCLKELGETIDIRFERKETGSEKTETFFRSHEVFDGIGAFQDILEKEGIPAPSTPQLDPKWKRPGIFKRLVAMWRAATYPINWEVQWKKRITPKGENLFLSHAFSKEETNAIRQAAKKAGCGMTAYLLIPLNRVLLQELIDPDEHPQLWQVPVNLRSGEESNNRSSYIAMEFSEGETTASFTSKFQDRLQKNIHWGVWGLGAFVGRWMKPMARKWVRRHYENQNPPFVGSFANIGNWVVPQKEAETWALSGIVTKIRPLGAAAMTFNGRLSLSLLFHNTLENDPAKVSHLLDLWKKGVIDFEEETP